ncbi:isochorismatase hydrolase [Cladophialophora carrionii]|uniref:Isochorismatase hydrolase n=1 Tax=Cladophialophora carrionii TaxID=86049 RepID=A0A1C1CHR2_9EURO|nr:isochorismatase hydrolase [Cladophialophora carrionii]
MAGSTVLSALKLLGSALLLSQLCSATPVKLEERQAYAMIGDGFEDATMTLGSYYNYWTITNGTFDLTRSLRSPTTSPKTLPMMGRREAIKIEPNRTALVIIDMQNFFLHPELSPAATDGRAAVAPTVRMIEGFRKHGMKILWVNWGLTEYDLLTIPPAFKAGFSGGSNLANDSFGSDMGTLKENGSTIEVGRLLMRGSWNAEPYGVLGTMKDAGIKAGTDLVFNKNRLSGLWGPQTPLGLWLQENEMTTLFFGGVNADQCVWSTLVDAYFKGYDVVYVDDISQTTSPSYAVNMTRYNAQGYGFMGNSTAILKALG